MRQVIRSHRSRVFVCMVLWLVLLSMGPHAGLPQRAYAGAAAEEAGNAETYERLKAGIRLLGDKKYDTPEQPTVYLTFDDGPSKLTGRVLDILQEEDVKATFFALGSEAEKRPEWIRRIVSDGHSLGNHSYNHVYKELYGDFDSYWEQLRKTESAFYEQTGSYSRLIRAPGGTFGNFDPFFFYYLDQAGYTVFDWNIDSGDARRSGVKASEIVDTVAGGPFRHELVVLLHDGTGHDETVKALPDIIRMFKEKGYAFAPLTDKVKPVLMAPGKSKWPRSYTQASFEKTAEIAAAHAELYKPAEDARVQDRENRLEEEPPGPVHAEEEPIPLAVKLDGQRWELEGRGYLFKEGRFFVPLRQLVERMGGKVEWDAESRMAVVGCGTYRLHYDTVRRELVVMKPGVSVKAYPLAYMELRDGSLFVPLRSTAELLGHEIAGYMLGGHEREVDITLHSPSFLQKSMKSD